MYTLALYRARNMGAKINLATFAAKIQNGKILFRNPKRFDLFVSQMIGEVRLTIERVKKVRTSGAPGERSNMNGYYWLYIHVIADETGNDPNDLHEYFKIKLLPPRIIHILTKEVTLPATTTELSGIEMMELMQKIENLTGVPIPPHPDDKY